MASERPTKRMKLDKPVQMFSSVEQIRAGLGNQDGLAQTLTALRNQLTIHPGKENIAPSDARLLLVQNWVEQDPGASEVLALWQTSNHRQSPLTPLILAILSSILNLLNSHYPYHQHGFPLIKTLLSSPCIHRLNALLSGSTPETILVTLRLFNAISGFAAGREKKGLLEGMHWDIKTLHKLLTMRRRTQKSQDTSDVLLRPDIRTSTLLLLLSFLTPSTPSHLKSTFFSIHKDAFLSLFKGLIQDPYSVVKFVLETIWMGLWCDPKVKRTLKVGVFGEGTLGHIIKLYDRSITENSDPNIEDIPADLIHHFLLAICTRPGTGVCFKDQGWYPKDNSSTSSSDALLGDKEESGQRNAGRSSGGGKIYNKILSNVLRTLKVNEDPRQQELALKILEACPELVHGLNNLTPHPLFHIPPPYLFVLFVLFPLSSQFHKSSSYHVQPLPPPLPTILSSILPTALSKAYLTKGLLPSSSSSPLVQHCTAMTLVKSLRKFERVRDEMWGVSRALDEGDEGGDDFGVDTFEYENQNQNQNQDARGGGGAGKGMWARRVRELENEMKRRVPDVGVVVGMVQQYSASSSTTSATTSTSTPTSSSTASTSIPSPATDPSSKPQLQNPVQRTLLSEVSQRLLWLYYRLLPTLIQEGTKFDVGRLLVGLSSFAGHSYSDGVTKAEKAKGLGVIRALHVLRLLKESESFQFGWAAKTPGSQHTHTHTLLRILFTTPIPAVRTACEDLIRSLWAKSILFEADPMEVVFWIEAMPGISLGTLVGSTQGGDEDDMEGDEKDDGGGDDEDDDEKETEGFLAFLEECIQRCIKTPYRYYEDMQALTSSSSSSTPASFSPSHTSTHTHARPNPHTIFSPLLITILEQLHAKIKSDSKSQSQSQSNANKSKAGQQPLLGIHAMRGVVRFVRRLCLALAGKLDAGVVLAGPSPSVGNEEGMDVDPDLYSDAREIGQGTGVKVLRGVMAKMRDALEGSVLANEDRVVEKEMRVFECGLRRLEGLSIGGEEDALGAKESKFLDGMDDASASISSVLSWLRRLSSPLGQSEIEKILHLAQKYHPAAIGDVLEYIPSSSKDILHAVLGLDLNLQDEHTRGRFLFQNLYLATSEDDLQDNKFSALLVDSILSPPSSSTTPSTSNGLADVERAICLIRHRIIHLDTEPTRSLELVGSILRRAKEILPNIDFITLMRHVFGNEPASKTSLRGLFMMKNLSPSICDVVGERLLPLLDPAREADRVLVNDIAEFWYDILRTKLSSGQDDIPAPTLLWIKFLHQDALLALLDRLSSSSSHSASIFDTVLHALQLQVQSSNSTLGFEFSKRLDKLFSIRNACPNSISILDELVVAAVDACLPMGLDSSTGSFDIGDLVRNAESRWSRISSKLCIGDEARGMLDEGIWTESKARTIAGLVFMRAIDRESVLAWMRSGGFKNQQPPLVALVVVALFDSIAASSGGEECDGSLCENLLSFMLDGLIPGSHDSIPQHRASCGRAIISIFSAPSKAKLPALFSSFTSRIKSCSPRHLNVEMVLTVIRIRSIEDPPSKAIEDALASVALQWAVDYLSAGAQDSVAESILRELPLLSEPTAKKPQLVDPVLTAAIQHRLNDPLALDLCSSALQGCQLKPLLVNRHLQTILQHPHFYKVCVSTSASRDSVINLLYVLFNLHPSNTCQPSHIQPLISIYHGSSSSSDRKLLSVFQLFELQRKLTVASLFKLWSGTAGLLSNNALEALCSVDPIRVLKTCLSFPDWRRLEEDVTVKDDPLDSQCFDPVFCVLLCTQMLYENPPESAFSWVELFRTNVIGLVIRCMSSKDDRLRELALTALAGLWGCLQDADIQEKPHVLHILNLFRDVFSEQSGMAPRRLPSYTTLLISHALRGIFYPSNFIYPVTARFLLQRPEFDTEDVPMLFSMLYSSKDDWKKERAWMIKFLADGMQSSDDWRVLKRRHTWDILASLFQGSSGDLALRKGILEVLTNITRNAQATVTLVLKHALLVWIEMQLLTHTRSGEVASWVNILENILIVAGNSKLESVTNNEWRSTVCRCLSLLLDRDEDSQAIFHSVPPFILRLMLVKGPRPLGITPLLSQAINSLQKFEQNIGEVTICGVSLPRSYTPSSNTDLIQTWGTAVEQLWRSVMEADDAPPEQWRALTSRLLLWHSIIGGEGRRRSEIAEWARREVIRNMNLEIGS